MPHKSVEKCAMLVFTMRILRLCAVALILFFPYLQAIADPLPSWNEGATKQAIVEFVGHVTDASNANYVPPAERLATFDNDGTLWVEQPLYTQLAFAIDRVRALAPEHPEWQTHEPFAALLKGDLNTVLAGGEAALLEIVLATHAGMTNAEFEQTVLSWLATAQHPKTGKLYTEMVYQPMLELMDYLRDNDFRVYIASGGGIDFMRPWTSAVYGIPPERVIGSRIKKGLEERNGQWVIVREPAIEFINDKTGKPIGIDLHTGRRPIAAFGNSDGDLAMLQWTTAGDGLRFALFVQHTDAEREWAYDRESSIGRLDQGLTEARAKGWAIADMQRDWKVIYPFELSETD